MIATDNLPVKVISGRSHTVVPFKTLVEAEEFIRELGRNCPEVVYRIEFEDLERGD